MLAEGSVFTAPDVCSQLLTWQPSRPPRKSLADKWHHPTKEAHLPMMPRDSTNVAEMTVLAFVRSQRNTKLPADRCRGRSACGGPAAAGEAGWHTVTTLQGRSGLI